MLLSSRDQLGHLADLVEKPTERPSRDPLAHLVPTVPSAPLVSQESWDPLALPAPRDPRDPEATKVSQSQRGIRANHTGGLVYYIEHLFQVIEAARASQATTGPRVNLDGLGRWAQRERRARQGCRASQDSSASPALSVFQ